ncbi:MAG: phosphoglucosamine mutase [Saprospiraceae bacterium]|nr:phosphoglucosamine mutase [Saprospiraceae bacterium]
MTLIKSISGIRGTIGGKPGANLTPIDIVECTAGYGLWIKKRSAQPKVVVGRDGRITGKIVSELAINTLLSMGIDVVNLDLSTTPTVEIAVTQENASGGIIFTASHNPKQWNALKFLNAKGEFISAQDGEEILNYISEKQLDFANVDELGTLTSDNSYIEKHIDMILDLPYVNIPAIQSKSFTVVVDCINSTGAISVPPLLERLGCTVHLINEEITGIFAHNPEPRPEHLLELSQKVVELNADVGISIDPDVDRLAFVSEDGSMFGEEYTLVAVADSILGKKKGNTVSNLSSTRALADVTSKHGGQYKASAVGEVNVVNAMKETNAVIGGEGNGGVILPDLHFGRDALAGIALMLDLLAESNSSMSQLKAGYPSYTIVKDKIELTPAIDVDYLLTKIAEVYSDEKLNTTDGLKIDFEEGWIHMRKSNTEPIIRVYSEASTTDKAKSLAEGIKNEIDKILQ